VVKKNNTIKTGKKITNDLILLLPILLFTTVYMFCVRAWVVPNSYQGFFWWENSQYTGDLYAYFRMQVFSVVTILFFVYMLFCVFQGKVKIQKRKVYIPMVIYAVMAVVSYIFSEYKDIALFGANGKYEGTLTLICYMLILFYTMHAVSGEKNVKLVVKCFAVTCFFLGLWGIMQTMGVDLNDLPAWLYVPAQFREVASMEEAVHTNAVTWFFTNQNYISFFMIFPIYLFAMSCIAEESGKKKVLYAVLTGLMLFSLWQAASLGGMVGLAVAVVAALLIAGVKNIVKWRKSLGMLILVAVVSMGASLPVIMGEVQSGADFSKLPGIDAAYAAGEEESDSLQFVKIDHIITDGPEIVFSFEGEEVRIKTENDTLKSVADASGKELSADNPLVQISTYTDEGTGYTIIVAKTANKEWKFVVTAGQTYFVSQTGQGIKLDKVESMGFEDNQGFATYRGYIWSRTLPLLKDTLLLGKGADTYAIYFPQDDYAGRYNIGYYKDTQNTIIDKPHNMYLGWAVNTGVVSMIALVAVFVIYLIESIKVYRKHTYEGFIDYIGMGIFIAIVGFMVSGLVNDTTIQMMPLVYVFLGMGFAINHMLKEKKD